MSKQDDIKAQQRFGEAVRSGNLDVIRDRRGVEPVDVAFRSVKVERGRG